MDAIVVLGPMSVRIGYDERECKSLQLAARARTFAHVVSAPQFPFQAKLNWTLVAVPPHLSPL